MVANNEESEANEVLIERQKGIVRSVLTRGLIGGVGRVPSVV